MPVFTPPGPVEPYATSDDVALLFKRPLTTDEQNLADHLTGVASRRIRSKFPTLDARISAGTVDPLAVTDVVAAMVWRALLAGDNGDAVQSRQEVAGPFSQQVTYANPMGNLYFTADDLAVLSGGRGQRRAFSLDLTPQPIVP